MNGIEIETEKTVKDELYKQYNWFQMSFLPAIQNASNEFFTELFTFKLISASRNVNLLFQGDEYFVTKIRIDKEHEIFFRCSSDAVKIILDNVLGQCKKFNLSNITELEAKLISSFNDYLYNSLSRFLINPKNRNKNLPPQKRKNFDFIHLTFFIRDKQSESGAKLIVSLPQNILAPRLMRPARKSLDISTFKTSKVDVKLKIGKTKFSLKELKNLEKEDIVIFEESDIHSMKLVFGDYEKNFKVNPNLNLITSINNNEDSNNGGNIMEEGSFSQDLWDNIQIDMGAEFEKVKISLGELRNIEQGLVVDIGSVYSNKVALKVENKAIAEGELVIINDRYGVRVDKVFASEKAQAEQIQENPETEETIEESAELHEEDEEAQTSNEEFDYSDFELDDEDI